MKLFLPSPRAVNYLLIVGFSAIGYALYLRYMAIENTPVGLACAAGLNTWLCFSRKIAAALFDNSVFGITALIIAAINLLRPTLLLFGLALAVICFGLVLYNIALSALAAGLLVLSLARREPEPD